VDDVLAIVSPALVWGRDAVLRGKAPGGTRATGVKYIKKGEAAVKQVSSIYSHSSHRQDQHHWVRSGGDFAKNATGSIGKKKDTSEPCEMKGKSCGRNKFN